jgi:hypothetical protein
MSAAHSQDDAALEAAHDLGAKLIFVDMKHVDLLCESTLLLGLRRLVERYFPDRRSQRIGTVVSSATSTMAVISSRSRPRPSPARRRTETCRLVVSSISFALFALPS